MHLYHKDAYIKEFVSSVVSCEKRNNGFAVELSDTAFYPTGGGQPYDMGTINGIEVADVIKEGDRVIHILPESIDVGTPVKGVIDWERRFDHMCQHAGDHLIAGIIDKKFGGVTLGLHIGAQESYIDVDMGKHGPKLTREELDDVESEAMTRIQQDAPIRCWFPSDKEMKELPLRKDPTVDSDIRVVLMGDFECVACAGTHPSSTGQIGMVKILRMQPNRGNMRVFFLAGKRAFEHYQRIWNEFEKTCALFSAAEGTLFDRANQYQESVKKKTSELNGFRTKAVLSRIDDIKKNVLKLKKAQLYIACLDEAPENAVRELTAQLIENPKAAAIVINRTADKASLIFARGEGCSVDMGDALRTLTLPFSGRGGGKPAYAMGAMSSDFDLEILTNNARRFFN
ncbi:MAG: hypothetical protein IJB92_05240 [Clostridia bacterium]|nr:hypothetical protein [Clostridia bacterium]